MAFILILIALLTLLGWSGNLLFVELPISVWDSLSLPQWFWLIVVISLLSWGMGDY